MRKTPSIEEIENLKDEMVCMIDKSKGEEMCNS